MEIKATKEQPNCAQIATENSMWKIIHDAGCWSTEIREDNPLSFSTNSFFKKNSGEQQTK